MQPSRRTVPGSDHASYQRAVSRPPEGLAATRQGTIRHPPTPEPNEGFAPCVLLWIWSEGVEFAGWLVDRFREPGKEAKHGKESLTGPLQTSNLGPAEYLQTGENGSGAKNSSRKPRTRKRRRCVDIVMAEAKITTIRVVAVRSARRAMRNRRRQKTAHEEVIQVDHRVRGSGAQHTCSAEQGEPHSHGLPVSAQHLPFPIPGHSDRFVEPRPPDRVRLSPRRPEGLACGSLRPTQDVRLPPA